MPKCFLHIGSVTITLIISSPILSAEGQGRNRRWMACKQEEAPNTDTTTQENLCGVPLPPRINLARALTDHMGPQAII